MAFGPGAIFRRLARVAERRPGLVTAIGLGLVAEGARVMVTTTRGGPVPLLGHSGLTWFDVEADRAWLLLYVAWVTLCGMLLVAVSGRARRARAAARRSLGGRLRTDARSGRTRI